MYRRKIEADSVKLEKKDGRVTVMTKRGIGSWENYSSPMASTSVKLVCTALKGQVSYFIEIGSVSLETDS